MPQLEKAQLACTLCCVKNWITKTDTPFQLHMFTAFNNI